MLDSEDKIRSFYQDSLSKHGMTPKGMAYADVKTHFTRLQKVREIVEMLAKYSTPDNILDVGCGYGLLPMEWEAEGYMRPSETVYHGIDVVPEYLNDAIRLHESHPHCCFYLANYLDQMFDDAVFDITLAIGTFAWQPLDTVMEMIEKMWQETMHGGVMVFNNLPDMPIPFATVRWLRGHLGASEFLWYDGYSSTVPGEGIAAYVKR